MSIRRRVIGIVSLVAAIALFLAGYWPERQRRAALQSDHAALAARLTVLEDHARAARLHVDVLNILDAIRAMNYGQANTQSSAFFDRVLTEIPRTSDARLSAALKEIVASRDAVIGALATGDSGAAAPLERAERQLREFLAATPSAA